MTFTPRKTKDISVPDVFCTICLHTWSHSELNNCNYCNCLSIWACSRYPDVALYPLLRLRTSCSPAVSSCQYWEPAASSTKEPAANCVCWWHKYSPARSGIKLVQDCNYGPVPCSSAPCSLCIYQHALKILSDGHSQRSKNRIGNKTGHDLPDAGSWGSWYHDKVSVPHSLYLLLLGEVQFVEEEGINFTVE